ncbi:hypothetical protein N7471_013862 [Penicillium samsonianum]|uniref:uncharacterized protein n=1 Tax=Penicillium samsonianum TaxID=1882272 RepID=UPI00254941EB|nr:uncharacterized protein N7471_013660 [Penicillium samsonianum]XP_057129059.1 uncharacterized protein N7471_013862 [Penicillium samsonianum]KAJ6118193.1 hypothetical protein N7471_013660 [Penicillium samsonianum]KAJ6118395.1 hypothetical protein N7471_013862 [Penicillium samsonianum]
MRTDLNSVVPKVVASTLNQHQAGRLDVVFYGPADPHPERKTPDRRWSAYLPFSFHKSSLNVHADILK